MDNYIALILIYVTIFLKIYVCNIHHKQTKIINDKRPKPVSGAI